jgi:hypothetical protein
MIWRRRVVLLMLVVAACTRTASNTPAELREAIAAYERGDAAAGEDRVAALFAKLDADVATARADELAAAPADRGPITTRREALESERNDLRGAYLQARVKRLGVAADEAIRGMADQLGRGLEDAGKALREGAGK